MDGHASISPRSASSARGELSCPEGCRQDPRLSGGKGRRDRVQTDRGGFRHLELGLQFGLLRFRLLEPLQETRGAQAILDGAVEALEFALGL